MNISARGAKDRETEGPRQEDKEEKSEEQEHEDEE